MRDRYDMIVVGGGPAGAWTAKNAAQRGVSVLVLEKDREIGLPVRCAEGVAEKSLLDEIDVNPRWISQVITRARLVSPGGIEVDAFSDERGFILHRKLFDADLAFMAAEAGADVRTKAYVHGLLKEDGFVTGVKMTHMGREYEISASIVVGADGPESRVGRWAGMDTALSLRNTHSCVQMTLSGLDIDPEMVQFYMGSTVAPGGYLWIFPKGPGVANVGLGVSGVHNKEKRAIEYLREFIDRKFPDASIHTVVAGCVPTSPPLKEITAHGLILVGDAARQDNPISGGGIINALISGRIAGDVAAEAVKKGDVSQKAFKRYVKEWNKAEGKVNERSYKIKTVVEKITDDEFDAIATTLLNIPPEKRTAFEIFKVALMKHPKMILEAAKVFV